MDRRHFLLTAGSASLALASELRASEPAPAPRLLFLIDLVGGNDALNTLAPHTDAGYYRARPTIALDRRTVLPIAPGQALHPSLRPLMPLWDAGELALVQGVGCTGGSVSHHRATEILDSALLEDAPLQTGWLARCLSLHDGVRHAATQALTVSSDLPGPLHGLPRCRRLADEYPENVAGRFGFPQDVLGCALAQACAELLSGSDAAVVRVALDGFDTHENQPSAHAPLLASLAASMTALRGALSAMGRWRDTLVLTRSEFGRLAHENLSAGTDHGNAGIQLLTGGRVVGGLHGRALSFDALDARGAFVPTVDFRSVYASISSDWIGVNPVGALAATPPLRGLLHA